MHKLNSKGFTLIELAIVIVIIAVLVAVLFPVYTKYIDKSRVNVCLTNRDTLASEVYIEYAMGDYASLSDCFSAVYASHSGKQICPVSGSYIWIVDSPSTGHVLCSVHGDQANPVGPGSGGDKPNYYPGTTSPINDSVWPPETVFPNNYDTVFIPAGGIFLHDGAYYVVTTSLNLNKLQASSGPGGEVYNWYATQRITGRIVTYSSDSEQKSDLARGDICKVGEDYYVYKDGGSWAHSPTVTPEQWYKLPA